MLRGQRGFALLIVLWSLVLVSFLIARLTFANNQEIGIARNLKAQAMLQAEADGVAYEGAFHLQDQGEAHWPADGATRVIHRSGLTFEVAMTDEAERINPNIAPPALLRALLRVEGVSEGGAAALADRIADWREPGEVARPAGAKTERYRAAGWGYGPPDAPFRDLDELGLVMGMTPTLLTALAPHLSVFASYGPHPFTRDPNVAAALRLWRIEGGVELQAEDYQPVDVVRIRVRALGRDGTATRETVMRFAPQGAGTALRVLAWR